MKHLFGILLLLFTLHSCAQKDDIIGVWEVDNDYYKATYEIVAYKGKYYGKVHYYDDGHETYEGNDKEEDYFLTDVILKDGKYVNGKMYNKDGSFTPVTMILKEKNTLEVKMKIDNQPYTETWLRNPLLE